MDINWNVVKKMGRKKAIEIFRKAYPDLDFPEMYDKKFPPQKPTEQQTLNQEGNQPKAL